MKYNRPKASTTGETWCACACVCVRARARVGGARYDADAHPASPAPCLTPSGRQKAHYAVGKAHDINFEEGTKVAAGAVGGRGAGAREAGRGSESATVAKKNPPPPAPSTHTHTHRPQNKHPPIPLAHPNPHALLYGILNLPCTPDDVAIALALGPCRSKAMGRRWVSKQAGREGEGREARGAVRPLVLPGACPTH